MILQECEQILEKQLKHEFHEKLYRDVFSIFIF